MEFIAAKCPNCAGELRLPDDKKQVKCMYCGFDVIIREAVAAMGPNVENLKSLAFAAEVDRNNEEAYEYFKKMLEFEPDNFDALLGKAIAAENLSSYNFDTGKYEGPPRILNSVRRAIDNFSVEDRELIKVKAAARIFKNCFGTREFAHQLDPQNEDILVSLYEGSKEMAISYSDYSVISASRDHITQQKYEAEAAEWLSKLDALNSEAALAAAAKFTDQDRKLAQKREDEEAAENARIRAKARANNAGIITGIIAVLILVLILVFCCTRS